MIVISNIIH